MEEKWGGRKEKEIKGHLPYFSSVWKQSLLTQHVTRTMQFFRFLYLIFICPHFNFAFKFVCVCDCVLVYCCHLFMARETGFYFWQ